LKRKPATENTEVFRAPERKTAAEKTEIFCILKNKKHRRRRGNFQRTSRPRRVVSEPDQGTVSAARKNGAAAMFPTARTRHAVYGEADRDNWMTWLLDGVTEINGGTSRDET
jgi:hypothetical protein